MPQRYIHRIYHLIEFDWFVRLFVFFKQENDQKSERQNETISLVSYFHVKKMLFEGMWFNLVENNKREQHKRLEKVERGDCENGGRKKREPISIFYKTAK